MVRKFTKNYYKNEISGIFSFYFLNVQNILNLNHDDDDTITQNIRKFFEKLKCKSLIDILDGISNHFQTEDDVDIYWSIYEED